MTAKNLLILLITGLLLIGSISPVVAQSELPGEELPPPATLFLAYWGLIGFPIWA